jgi:hypothetical protein
MKEEHLDAVIDVLADILVLAVTQCRVGGIVSRAGRTPLE